MSLCDSYVPPQKQFCGVIAIVLLLITEIKFQCELLIGSYWRICIQSSLQGKRCMKASSVGLIHRMLSCWPFSIDKKIK